MNTENNSPMFSKSEAIVGLNVKTHKENKKKCP